MNKPLKLATAIDLDEFDALPEDTFASAREAFAAGKERGRTQEKRRFLRLLRTAIEQKRTASHVGAATRLARNEAYVAAHAFELFMHEVEHS